MARLANPGAVTSGCSSPRTRSPRQRGRPKGHVQPTEMPNALSPISTTVVETRLQEPAAATAIASAKTYRLADKTRPPS